MESNTMNLDKTVKEQYGPGPHCYRDLQNTTGDSKVDDCSSE